VRPQAAAVSRMSPARLWLTVCATARTGGVEHADGVIGAARSTPVTTALVGVVSTMEPCMSASSLVHQREAPGGLGACTPVAH
jgi:hypothetical protein